jgi:hypothetical protein
MVQSDDKEMWKLRFTVEVAAMYHDWRRGSLGTLVAVVRGASLIGAVVSFAVVNSLSSNVVLVISWVSAVTGAIVLIDLVFGIDRRAREHDELFGRCQELQARMLEGSTPLPILRAEAQRIWKDEPPILWAIYAKCWNQMVTKHESGALYKKKVGFWVGLFGRFIQFSPQKFEVKDSASA